MLTLITAQHFESLQTVLIGQLMQPDEDPLRLEPVLVPSTALRRALSLAVADAHQVCAQVQFSFLAQWLWVQMAAVVPDIPADSPFDPDCLRWRLLRLLDAPHLLDAHPRLRRYLEGADAVMRFDLAGQLASLFDQYITYRQDWLANWAEHRLVATPAAATLSRQDEAWQAALWRGLLDDLHTTAAKSPASSASQHPVQRFLSRLAAAHAAGVSVPGLPKALHVFCVPTMSPLYLQVLEGLAQHIDVTLYVLDPSQEYWYDTISQRHLAQRVVRGEDGGYAVGHRLLSAWGRQTQSFLQLLLASDTPRREFGLPGRGAPADTLLGAVQADIIALRDLQPGSLHGRVHADGSLQVAVCHGLMRELEALHDHLLRCFARDATLRPEDVLVVVPDLETAAPLIEAVFGQEVGATGGGTDAARRALPFAITGLAPAASSPLAQALLTILDYARSRMPLSGLLELLHQPTIAAGLGLADDQVARLAGILHSASVHWGLDAGHLQALQLPGTAGHTLQEGLTRLLLGHALPDDHAGVWQQVLPAGNVEGSDALLLGVLHDCVTRLRSLRMVLERALLPDDWFRLLDQVLRTWLPAGAAQANALSALRADLQAQHQELQAAATVTPLPAEVLLRALQTRLQGQASGGVATGAITFAAIASLRSLPFRQICVIGLDDGVFPTVRRPLDVDLLSAYPRLGDRQRSEDERNLFLDLLLAARSQLYLGYSGRSARDDSVRPPSVLLAELLDALVPALCTPGADGSTLQRQRAALVTAHALQPFDARYFQASPDSGHAGLPRSFQAVYAAALRRRARPDPATPSASLTGAPALFDVDAAPSVLTGGAIPAGQEADADVLADREEDDAPEPAGAEPAFFMAPLPPPEAEWRQVRLEQLIEFMQHPARYLLRRRLGLALPTRETLWEDAEDFLPVFGAAQALARRVLPALLAGSTAAGLQAAVAAGTEYPAGALGNAERDRALQQLEGFARQVRTCLSAPPEPARTGSVPFQLDLETWTLSGNTGRLHAAQVDWRFHPPWVGDELEAWIRHLWLCSLAGQPGQAPAVPLVWLFSNASLVFPVLEPAEAHAHLQGLLHCYRHGLQQPLHFYPKSARVLAESGDLAQALQKWTGRSPAVSGESEDPAWRLALRGVADPMDAQFVVLAERIWGPLLGHARTLDDLPEVTP